MSFEALPNELLVKVFSHLPWKTLRNLSLVNRRWNQVVGMTNKVSLRISKYICHRQLETKHFEDICIPIGILHSSSRDYRHFSCYLRSKDSQFVSGAFGLVLAHCQQRWNIKQLRILSSYNQFILFMEYYRHLMSDVVTLVIKVLDVPPEYVHFGESNTNDTHFMFRLEKLQTLNLEYGSRNLNTQSPTCFIRLCTPRLQSLSIWQNTIQTNVHLTFHDSPNIRSIMFFNKMPVHYTRKPDPVELESILPQLSGTTGLKLENCVIAKTFSSMFENLQTINLTAVKITPTDHPVECLSLTKLELQTIMLQKPLKLRIPQLHTLICDSRVLQLLHLEDAFKADHIEMKLNGWDFNSTAYTVGMSSFRRLHLPAWVIQRSYDASVGKVWSYLSGITELNIRGEFSEHHFIRLREICKHFPLLNSLHLERMIVPGRFNFLPVSVQNIFINNCAIQGSSIEFPTSVECVQVHKLWNPLGRCDDSEINLLPVDRYRPLVRDIIEVQMNQTTVSRTIYSTQNCHALSDKLSDIG